MEKTEATKIAITLLISNGYQITGSGILAPDTDSPLDAISIQNELSNITYFKDGSEFTFKLRYEGDKLKMLHEKLSN